MENEIIETEEQKTLRLGEKKREFTQEEEDAIIEKRFGVKADQLIKKEDQVKVLSEEEKLEIENDKNAKKLTTALEKKWFTQSEYDEHQQLLAKGKVDIAKQKFIEDNPELGKEEAGQRFSELFLIDQDDEIEEDEEMKPNVKKALAIKQAEKIADDYIKNKFGKITSANEKFEQFLKETNIAKNNVATFNKVTTGLPGEIQIPIGETGTFVQYKISEEDRKEAQNIFLGDKKLVVSENIQEEELKENALTYIKAKNFETILESAVNTALTAAQDRYERGEKGIIPIRADKGTGGNSAVEWMKGKGLKV